MTIGGLETALAKAAAKAGKWAAGRALAAEYQRRLTETSHTVISAHVAQTALEQLGDAQIQSLSSYLESPDVEEIALQVVLARLLNYQRADEVRASIREQIRYGLRHALSAEPYLLTILSDLVYDALVLTAQQIPPSHIESGRKGDAVTVATLAHLTAAATANSHLLQALPDLTQARRLAADLRRQVALLHDGMYLPHIGASRKVPYRDLYVQPPVYRLWSRTAADAQDELIPPEELLKPGQRNVVLGSPGAGKSTLLSKLAYDLATDAIPELAGRVPFLVTLRHFTSAFIQGERGISAYLEAVCKDPYNLATPVNGVEYLLRNGRAVVLLDGLDELVDQELRSRVAKLVEGFAHQYPLVPVALTARVIGYEAAAVDPALFHTAALKDFDDGQVEDYARRWFVLDEATPRNRRQALASSFLADSAESAAELRKSPLLLALLCAMYSSEHYIPRHVSQVYERCAVMLFERWDSMRGISMPHQFRGRVRGAVQYLAWLQLNNVGQGAIAATRILRSIESYLEAKHLDPDDSRSAAEDFLAFCTGRSWILTDTGSTEDEARYGFTHRTFMEYFAAEHIVRTNRTAAQLWEVLEPKIAEGAWDVVGQVAVQLYDRNVDDGSDELLRLLFSRLPEEPASRSQLLAFAARSLNHVTPAPQTAASIAREALDMVIRKPTGERYPFFPPPRVFEDLLISDGPFHDVLEIRLEENVQAVAGVIAAILAHAIGDGNLAARHLVLDWSTGDPARATPLTRAVLQHPAGAQDLNVEPATEPAVLHGLISVVAEPAFLYRFAALGGFLYGPQTILSDETTIGRAREICETMMRLTVPWVSGSEWHNELQATSLDEEWFRYIRGNLDERDYYLQPLLLLPYLESAFEPARRTKLPVSGGPSAMLMAARHGRSPLAFPSVPPPATLERSAHDFLTDWANRKFSVIGDG